MIQAIVFDFDGVIVDTEPIHHRAFLKVLEPLGFDVDYPTYLEHYAGFDDRDLIRAVYQARGEQPPQGDRLQALIDRKAEVFKRIVETEVEPYPGAIELVESAAASMPIAIASGALRRDLELILPRLDADGLLGRFETIVTADDVERSKPDPQTYQLAASRLGRAPAHCLAIEDTNTGLQSARLAGLRRLGVTHTYPADQLVDAERVVDRLTDLDLAKLRDWFD